MGLVFEEEWFVGGGLEGEGGEVERLFGLFVV